ncbi:hypothetical protein HPB52_017884 [Rhipicephalus sanguineus]|uniref:DDE Tnp4 domain-containing protein n=1 Tax=Rhipicephalus sanguineus TaxID=34632 RepID=A0A9D4PJE8_RHISA|nr:hypothetical protein HPB52_017884 [Rhipicephalus sanguineus]
MADHVREFFAVTGFPQAVGALDGCHFPVSPPKKHATDYYNYKGWYSMILLALVDHRYRFRYIRVGSPGRCHDAGVHAASGLRKVVESAHFKSPQAMIEGTRVAPIILYPDVVQRQQMLWDAKQQFLSKSFRLSRQEAQDTLMQSPPAGTKGRQQKRRVRSRNDSTASDGSGSDTGTMTNGQEAPSKVSSSGPSKTAGPAKKG